MSTVALAAFLMAAPSASALMPIWAPPKHLRAVPKVGTRFTAFRVAFRAPAASGLAGLQEIAYTASATRVGRTQRSCISTLSAGIGVTRAGQRVTAVLRPAAYSQGWCRGTYRGSVYESAGPRCGPIVAAPKVENPTGYVCPLFATRLTTLGTFGFRVR